jgi:serine/threonine-protein kinase
MTAPAIPVGEREYRLPDLEVVPAPQIDGMELGPDDVLVARSGTRQPPVVLSADTVALLELFRVPRTLADAVLAHSRARGGDPLAMLGECFPVLQDLVRVGLLISSETDRGAVAARLAAGDAVGPAVCDRMIRLVSDTEIWQGHLADDADRRVAIKVVDAVGLGPTLVAAERAALELLDGAGAPRLHAFLPSANGGTLITEWIDGEPVDLVGGDVVERARLAGALLDHYARLHALGVVHGDPHPGNALVRPDGTLVLLDFGLARLPGLPPPPRPSGGEFLDPQAAALMLDGRRVDEHTIVDETYAVATLAYRIVCGAAYLDLETERTEALRRIRDDVPRRFAAVGGPDWPEGERVLRRALAKSPGRRHRDTGRLAAAFARALGSPPRIRSSAVSLRAGITGVVADLDIGGRWWPTGEGARSDLSGSAAAAAAEFLARVAVLVEDSECVDLAAVWSARAASAPSVSPGPGPARSVVPPLDASPMTAVRRALDRYRRTGDGRCLAAARRQADRLEALPDPGVPSLEAGPLAVLLARLECADPWAMPSLSAAPR